MNLGNLSWRYMKANKRRTILTILAIILSVALVTAVGLTFESSVKMMRRQFEATDGSWFAQVRGVSVAQARDIQKNVAVRQSGIRINELSAPIGPLPNYMLESRGEEHPFNKLPEDDINNQRVLSIMEMEQSAWDLLPYELVEGRRPESDSELVLDRASLEVMGLQVGDSVTLNTGFRYEDVYKRQFQASVPVCM